MRLTIRQTRCWLEAAFAAEDTPVQTANLIQQGLCTAGSPLSSVAALRTSNTVMIQVHMSAARLEGLQIPCHAYCEFGANNQRATHNARGLAWNDAADGRAHRCWPKLHRLRQRSPRRRQEVRSSFPVVPARKRCSQLTCVPVNASGDARQRLS